jgi:hypothetical protein
MPKDHDSIIFTICIYTRLQHDTGHATRNGNDTVEVFLLCQSDIGTDAGIVMMNGAKDCGLLRALEQQLFSQSDNRASSLFCSTIHPVILVHVVGKVAVHQKSQSQPLQLYIGLQVMLGYPNPNQPVISQLSAWSVCPRQRPSQTVKWRVACRPTVVLTYYCSVVVQQVFL